MSDYYICDNGHGCHRSDAGSHRERVSSDPPMDESWSCCPKCGSTDLEDADYCSECGTYYRTDEPHNCTEA